MRIFALLAVVLTAAACGDSSDTSPPDPRSDSNDEGPLRMPAAPPKMGAITVYRQDPIQSHADRSLVGAYAYFGGPTLHGEPAECSAERTIDSCTLRECRWSERNSVYSKHAGTLNVESPRLAGVTLEPDEHGWYPYSSVAPKDLLRAPAPDELVKVSAQGSHDVPTFELATTFPHDVRVVLPGQESEDGSRTLFGGALPRDIDLDIAYEPRDNRVELTATATGAEGTCQGPDGCAILLSCTFPHGPARIPADALATFAADQRVNIALASVNRATAKAGDYDIELAAIGKRWSLDFLVQ